MESVINGIETLFTSISGTVATRVEKLPQSGSDRIYFRIYEGSKTYIATYNLNQKETQTFIHFSKHFKTAGLPVPEVLGVNSDDTIYIQEDLGKLKATRALITTGVLRQKSLVSKPF